MRILHVDTGLEMRGGQWQVLRLMEGLATEGCRSVLLAPAAASLFQQAASRNLEVQPLRQAAMLELSRQASLTHAHDARAHTLGAVFARSPLIVARRVAFPIGRGFFSRRKYGRATHFIAVSQYVKGALVSAGIPCGRITVVYDGVPLPESAAAGDLVLAPATADPEKGTALAREAGSLAGVSLHLSQHLEQDLPRARLLVYITREEGLGSAALLALAHGVPVVASRVGGLPEAVEHESTGLLVDNKPEAIAAAIRCLLEDEALRARMAVRARTVASERFSIAAMVRATLSVYKRVL